jgi:hypothetical protein
MTEHARTNLAVIQEFLSVRGEFHRCESGWRVNISAHQR